MVRVVFPLLLFLAILTAGSRPISGQSSVLVSAGSVWRYLDNGSNQGTAWRSPGFNDSAWASGPAQLGYGDGDEATVVSYGANATAKYVTTYFRRTFSVTNPTAYASLQLRVLRDDGAVVYLNGSEVVSHEHAGGNDQLYHAGRGRRYRCGRSGLCFRGLEPVAARRRNERDCRRSASVRSDQQRCQLRPGAVGQRVSSA